MNLRHLGPQALLAVMLIAPILLVVNPVMAAGRYPKVNLTVSYEVDPAWPNRPEAIAWRYMTGVTVDAQGRIWTLNMTDPPVQVYSPEGEFLFSWGDGQFKAPHYIRIDHEGNVWAADYRRHIVRKFTEKGELLLTLGVPDEPGSDEAHLNMPTDMAIAPSGDVFVTDGYGNNRIVHYRGDGTFVKAWGTMGVETGQLSQPHTIAMDSEGLLYVGERNNCRVQIFDQDGATVAQWRNIINPWGIHITPSDEVIICGSTPARWSPRGNLGNPPHDQIVMKFDRSGRVLEHWAFPLQEPETLTPGCLDWIHGIGVDADGNLYLGDVADNSASHRVQKFVRLEPEHPIANEALDYDIQLDTPLVYDGGDFLWFHPRAAAVPDRPGEVVMTIQKHLKQSDYYSGMSIMRTTDNGVTWSGPTLQPELEWREEPDEVKVSVCDVTPGWHAPTGKVIAIGVKVRYRSGVQLLDEPQSHAVAYAVHDPRDGAWSEWRYVDVPEPDGKFFLVTPGCVQWLVEDSGDLLLPVYFRGPDTQVHTATVMRCGFEGETITYKEHGTELTIDVERGIVEPSLTLYREKYYLTLRNDQKGYVSVGSDGLNFAPMKPWTFDDGEELGSYNTQQHWVTHSDGLFLVYTRRGADNDHIFRHRAPLFIARVDPITLEVVRSTERELIPERGATLGNFGIAPISPNETWVTVSEGVWNDDMRKRGATGATFVARILWKKPNRLAPQWTGARY